MRKYRMENQDKLETLFCNCCGRQLHTVDGMAVEGACHLKIQWGYFSGMDGENHSFDLCEDCYKKLTGTFQIPVTVEERIEMI